jgi:branched-chain amino acid aminotransferase
MSPASAIYMIVNGEVVPAAEASVPADDRGFLYGDSVFTTLRCYGGVPFRLERHCARLNASLSSPEVGIAYNADPDALRRDIARLVELNGRPEAVVRFAVTRGRGVGALPPPEARPTTVLMVWPHPADTRLYSVGARLVVSSVRRDPQGRLGRHKLGSYFPSLLARREAAERGCDEAVICDTDVRWLECACSNLFAVVDGAVVTPDVTANVLPGIAREVVVECARELGLAVSLQDIVPDVAVRAAEWFITNSVQEVVPVARIEERDYPVPGPVTARLMRAYRDVVARETAGG